MIPLFHVNQFHSGTAVGDAITNEMISWRRHLRSLGFASEIYAQHIPPELAGEISDIGDYAPEPQSVLFLHHSMGHDILSSVLDHDHLIIPVYHNITPVEFIDHPYVRRYARRGHEMLFELAERAHAAVAASNFNRREMLRAGFRTARVIPVRTEFSSVRSEPKVERSHDWIFVGRLVPSKGQLELIETFADALANHDVGQQLLLVGDTSNAEYVADLELLAHRRNIAHRVRMMGKISDEQLAIEYARAGLFVSMSRHEGFGVPLLEAMAAGLPVIAYACAATEETMNGAGFCVPLDDTSQFVGACVSLLTDPDLYQRTIDRQFARIQTLERFDVAQALAASVEEARGKVRPLEVQIQGPFETSYSLAVLNRELAIALAKNPEFDVSIFATEGPGDYTPSPDDLARHPVASALHRKSSQAPTPDVVIRQMYPPRVNDSPGGLTFQYFGWEESRLPPEYVASFNTHLDGIGAMSNYVKTLMRNSGVNVPIDVVGVGVRSPDLAGAVPVQELSDARAFRFVHISSAFPRKGVDLLLDAYFREFSDDDDVSLILKTFPNPHNDAGTLLKEQQNKHPNPPHVIWIDRDMPENEIDGLYAAASALVHPSRGEGFGLPVAEAMNAGVPVIAPSSTGLADFVTDSTATVISHRPVPAETHLTVPGSMWEEPDAGALRRAMRTHVDDPSSTAIAERARNAQQLISNEFSWAAVAERFSRLILRQQLRTVAPRIAMVSTANSRCGIAEYTTELIQTAGARWHVEIHADRVGEIIDIQLEETIVRDWVANTSAAVDELIANLVASNTQIVHIQHNFGFIGLPQLAQIVQRLSTSRRVVVTLHRTEDLVRADQVIRLAEIAGTLARADRIIVHQHEDARRLHGLGLDNVEVIPIGSAAVAEVSTPVARKALGLSPDLDVPVIATYGFLLPHKGTLELIRAVGLLKDEGHDVALLAVCALHTDPTSATYEQLCLTEIQRLDLEDSVRLVTSFLQPEVSRLLLSAADILALPYHETSESSSASLRTLLPLGRPIIASDISIFADAAGFIVPVAAPPTARRLADEILDLVQDEDKRLRFGRLARQLADASSIDRSVAMHGELYHDLLDLGR